MNSIHSKQRSVHEERKAESMMSFRRQFYIMTLSRQFQQRRNVLIDTIALQQPAKAPIDHAGRLLEREDWEHSVFDTHSVSHTLTGHFVVKCSIKVAKNLLTKFLKREFNRLTSPNNLKVKKKKEKRRSTGAPRVDPLKRILACLSEANELSC